jgi:hypothetical protein
LNNTKFSIKSNIIRLKYDTKKMSIETIDINEKLKELLKNIDIK